jgi:hypothetical protein
VLELRGIALTKKNGLSAVLFYYTFRFQIYNAAALLPRFPIEKRGEKAGAGVRAYGRTDKGRFKILEAVKLNFLFTEGCNSLQIVGMAEIKSLIFRFYDRFADKLMHALDSSLLSARFLDYLQEALFAEVQDGVNVQDCADDGARFADSAAAV